MSFTLLAINGTSAISNNVDSLGTLYLTLGLFLATVALVLVNWWYLKKASSDTQESNKLTRESNNEQRKFNELIRLDIINRLRPRLQVVNTGLEISESSFPGKVRYYPNMANYGNIEANNIRIYFKVMDNTISNVFDILKNKDEIHRNQIIAQTSLAAGASMRIPNPVMWTKKENTNSVLIWIEYDFLDNLSDEVVYDVKFKATNFESMIPYLQADLKKGISDQEIRDKGAPM